MVSEEGLLNTQSFIRGWLHHLNLPFVENIEISNFNFDFSISSEPIVISISTWKKPISVNIINKFSKILSENPTLEIFFIAQDISLQADETIKRLNLPINLVHPNGLTDLAMKLASILKLDQITT